MTTLIVHEYTHIIHLDKSAGSPEYLRNIFGRFLFLFPNLFQPTWVLEGLATHKETDLEHGVGRGQSTMFATMMREEVANGLQPISHVNLPVKTWPAGTTRYLYGVYYMSFLAEKYGEDKIQEWVEEYSNNLFPFFINTTANKVFGKNLTPLWEEYEQWLIEKFQPRIDLIKAKGIRAGEQISEDAYRTDSVRAYSGENGDGVYYVRNGGYKRASLIHIDADGNKEELVDLNYGADLDLHPQAGVLLTQNEFCNHYTIYKDIYRYDEKSGKLKRLTECGRYLFASWHPDGKQIVAVHHDGAHFELHLLDEDARNRHVLWSFADNEIIGQVDVSPDGKNVVAAIWRPVDGWNLELFDLASFSWRKITTGVSITANPQYSPDGNILFSMEADQVYNLYRYIVADGTVEQLTNVIGGVFQSSQATVDGAIYYAGYSAEGYAIYKYDLQKEADKAAADVVAFKDDHLFKIDYQISPHQQQDYSAWSNMYPRWWFPTWQLSEQRSEFGIMTSGADALGIHNYSLSASYDTKLNTPAAQLNYAYAQELFLSATRLNEITLDSEGYLNRVSSRDIASAVLAFHETQIQKQHNILLGVIYDKTSDDKLASGATPFPDFEDNLLGLAWRYNSANYNPLSISLVDGMNLRLVAEDSDTLSSDFSGQVYTVDWRQYIRTGKESVFALRAMQGWGSDMPRPFKLGGVGASDDAVSILMGINSEAIFDKRSYALRGYDEGLPQLRGRRAQLLTGEWRFPLERIEKGVMAPPVGIMQWFGKVFAETGSAYYDSPSGYYSSAGVELVADINLFYGVDIRALAGYAHGFDKEIGDDVVYLKIGNSF
jgi:Tol biopolymer transport system component